MKLPSRRGAAIIWALFIILSSLFMRQVLDLVREMAGRETVSYLIWGGFFIAALVFAKVLLPIRSPKTFILVLSLLALGIVYAATLPLPEERVHILKYGLLGFLWAAEGKSKRANYLFGVSSGLIVSIFDEGLQSFLPYRVGDLRDVWINSLSATWGAALYIAYQALRVSGPNPTPR